MPIDLRTKLRYGTYDFANSGFLIIFQSLLFPLVLAQALRAQGAAGASAWGWLVAASSVLAIVSAPAVGKLADHVGRPAMFRLFIIGAAAGGILSGFLTSSVLWLAFCFLALNTLFELSQTTYDSFLTRLAPRSHDTNTLSAFAWGIGYVGGALFAGLYLLLTALGVPPSAILSVSAVLYYLLSLPAIRLAAEHDTPAHPSRPRLLELLKVRPPVPWPRLLTYWLIADAVAALTYFLPLYLSLELRFTATTISYLMVGGQLLAFPATALSGSLVNRFGHRTVVAGSLVVWVVALAVLTTASSLPAVALAVAIGSLVFGATQATLRSHFAHFLKPHEPAQGFGFYAVAQKSASIFAPAAGALLIAATGRLDAVLVLVTGLIVVALGLSSRLPLAGAAKPAGS